MALLTVLAGFLGDVVVGAIANVFSDISVDAVVSGWDKRVLNNNQVKKAVQNAFSQAVTLVFREFEDTDYFRNLSGEDQELIIARRSMLLEKSAIEKLFPLAGDWAKGVELAGLKPLFTQNREEVREEIKVALFDPYLNGLHPGFVYYLDQRLLDAFISEFINSAIKKDEKVRSVLLLSFISGINKTQAELNIRLFEMFSQLDSIARITESQKEAFDLLREHFRYQVVPQDIAGMIESRTRQYLKSLYPVKLVENEHNLQREINSEIENWIENNRTGFAVLVGEAGVGKTHLLANLASIYLDNPSFSVLFFKAEDFIGQDFQEAILNAIGLRRKPLNLDDVMTNLTIENKRRVMFFLDTLDLIAFNHGPIKLRILLSILRKYDALLVGASRPQEYNEFSELVEKKFSLNPLSEKEVLELLKKFNIKTAAEQSIVHSRRLIDLCKNPLHARMLVSTFDKFENVPTDFRLQELYNRYWLQKVASLREGANPPQGITPKRFREAKEELAEKIALKSYEEHALALREQEIKKILITDTIYDIVYNDLVDEGVLRQHGGKIEFMHQTLWEYAAARAIIKQERVDEALSDLWRAINRGVVLQLGIQSWEANSFDVFNKILANLRDAPFLNKVILIDILVSIDLSHGIEPDLLGKLVRNDYRLIDNVLGLIIYEGGRHSFAKLFDILEESCHDPRWEIRRRLAEALPNLITTNHEKAARIMEKLRNDFDEKWKTDVRRRVVEALPLLGRIAPQKAEEISRYRQGDEPYTIIAIMEFLHSIPSDAGLSQADLIAKLINQLDHDLVNVLIFLNELLRTIDENPNKALDMINSRLDDPERLIRICIARSAPRLILYFPLNVLNILEHYARPDEHKQVRRPVAKDASDLISFMRINNDRVLQEKALKIFDMLTSDPDDIIRRAVSDNLDDLLEIEPSVVRDIVVNRFINDENLFVRTRAQKLAMRLISYFPEQRDTLLRLVETVR